jgi:hypothetical protein
MGHRHLAAVLQAKLSVSEPDDAYEQEADRVADEVMRMPEPCAAGAPLDAQSGTPQIQRLCAACGEEQAPVRRKSEEGAPEAGIPDIGSYVDTLSGRGEPLAPGARAFFEPRFGVDFGAVRVHADAEADRSARAIQAHAYTFGEHIVFRAGRYDPGGLEGRHLLAHELAHVVQQGHSRAESVVQRAAPGDATKTDSAPCDPAKQGVLDATAKEIKEWAETGKHAVDEFIAGIEHTESAHLADIASALDRHFFHQDVHGRLTTEEQLSLAQKIRTNFQKAQAFNWAKLYRWVCATDSNRICGSADAYTSSNSEKNDRRIVFCEKFFKSDDRAAIMFHESMHAYAFSDDKSYVHERLYPLLRPESAIKNADSYAMFALEAMRGTGALRDERPKDSFTCEPLQRAQLQRILAEGEHMMQHAEIALESVTTFHAHAGLALRHFKTKDLGQLDRVLKQYYAFRRALREPIDIICDKSCPPGTWGHGFAPGGLVLVCLAFFQSTQDHPRRDWLLTQVLKGKGFWPTAERQEPAYAAQSMDEAFKNLGSYIGYASDVAKKVPE